MILRRLKRIVILVGVISLGLVSSSFSKEVRRSNRTHHTSVPGCQVHPDQELVNRSDETFYHFLKSADQLTEYLNHHFNQDTPDSYEPLVRAAASVFELPEQFLTCLFFKESTFKSKAVSVAGAKGVAQLTTVAAKEINHYIELKKDSRTAYRDRWESYFDLISENKDRCPVPSKFGSREITDPVTSIAGGALLAKVYYDQLIDNRSQMNQLDVFVLLSGAYNMGLSGLENACNEKTSAEQCKWKVSAETYSQMVAVRNCMEPNNWQGMTIVKPQRTSQANSSAPRKPAFSKASSQKSHSRKSR